MVRRFIGGRRDPGRRDPWRELIKVSAAGIRDANDAIEGIVDRAAEAAALNVGDVDRSSGEVKVLSGKGNKERITYADGGALAAVEGWLAYRGDHPGPCSTRS